jgi:hypothetical protein
MDKRIKGAGGLSRKLLTILVLSAMTTMGYAADNSIYIDQAGDNSTITMTQDGSGNRVKGILLNGTAGGTTDPAKLVGNAQTINIEQTGSANVLALGVNTTQGGSVAGYSNIGVNLNYQVTGGNNTGYININNTGIGTASGNVVSIIQDGSATATLNMTGASNQLTVNTAGGANNIFTGTINADETVASINQTGGGGNETTVEMTGSKGQVSLTSVGSSNITSIVQSAYGTTGAQIILDITGSGNNTSVTQSGSYDHYANIKLNAGSNDNTITLAQSGGSGTGHSTTLELLAGSSNNTIGITQQGSVANLSNIRMSGNNNSLTVLQKN